jgi:hypothetical protein
MTDGLFVRAVDTRSGRAGLRSEALRQVAYRGDYDGKNSALVEHFLVRSMEPEARHQVLLRIVFDDLALDRRVAADFRPTDKRRAVLPAYPDDHGAAAANALCLPGCRLGLDKHEMVWRYREPDRPRRALITVLADRGYIENAGGGKCVEVALGDLSARLRAVRSRLGGGRRRKTGRHRETAERDRAPCD